MEKAPLCKRYASSFEKLGKLSHAAAKIDETNVYQVANPETRKIMDMLVEDNTLPESHLEGIENFEKSVDERYGTGTFAKALQRENDGIRLSVTYYPSINEFRGKKTPQIVITHYMVS